jgi:hypothetical protein
MGTEPEHARYQCFSNLLCDCEVGWSNGVVCFHVLEEAARQSKRVRLEQVAVCRAAQDVRQRVFSRRSFLLLVAAHLVLGRVVCATYR